VSTFRSVAVFFDPLVTDVDALSDVMVRLQADTTYTNVVSGFSRTFEIPVAYGGEAGPDLDAVAEYARCTPQEVVNRHSARTYRVFMLGFLPGFPYMASVEDSIAVPRRAAPRARVARGAVGIAGRQTGIYPRESPGGWQIIGRTALDVFDPLRTPPALFAPGDTVRFVAVADESARWKDPSEPGTSRAGFYGPPATRYLTVLRPGLLTTVQDSGRWGHQNSGVPVAGAMDAVSHRLANALVGNPPQAAALEATVLGPELRLEQETTMAMAGADLQPRLDDADVPMHTSVRIAPGSILRLGQRRSGARAYVAFDGGIAAPAVLGSRATDARSGLGGFDGRALRAGDRLPLGDVEAGEGSRRSSDLRIFRRPEGLRLPGSSGGARVRVMPGPQADAFAPQAFRTLHTARFVISPASNRMGYRLTSDQPIAHGAVADMISDVTFPGGVQVPPSGDPILLMADRQTTGGYPQIAIVITADLPLAAQLAPGDWIEFAPCTRSEAMAALVAQEGRLLAVR
jgi:KipI family sensor histidine kinase inhibitor